MTKKIFRSIFTAPAVTLLVSLGLLTGVLYERFGDEQEQQLQISLSLAATAVEQSGSGYLESLDTDSYRLTLVAADGDVIFDSLYDADKMENHGDREEIKEALTGGSGQSRRYSSTITEKTVYYATRLSDGSVLRISGSMASVPLVMLKLLAPIVAIIVLALVLSGIIANRLSKNIVKPLNEIKLDSPLENDTYDELSPMLTHIEQQHRQIDSQIKELKRRQSEFYAVVENMNEGLVLLGKSDIILSINPAAAEFFSVDDDCVGKDFTVIERRREIGKALEDAKSDGRAEIQVSQSGREYQINLSCIDKNREKSGIVMLIFDITDRALAEKTRREFTANVSHELKTPLQSVMGRAELIENGMVKNEDIPLFAGHIRSEASRLLELINDIIRLSQLDESGEMPSEQADLYEIAALEVQSLSAVAEKRNVTLNFAGEGAVIKCVPRLLGEVVYNLCENAIKYNVEGGKVNVSVKNDGDDAVLTVTDSGIGIPTEHQSRVFERFYRVDKSRSKETGGTGLGLSIVKHAVGYMGGKITLQSIPDEGTTVTVRFKK